MLTHVGSNAVEMRLQLFPFVENAKELRFDLSSIHHLNCSFNINPFNFLLFVEWLSEYQFDYNHR